MASAAGLVNRTRDTYGGAMAVRPVVIWPDERLRQPSVAIAAVFLVSGMCDQTSRFPYTLQSEPQRRALSAQLERISGKRIRPRYSVDPALIGGAMARIGSTVYDGSVRGQLQTLGRRLSTLRNSRSTFSSHDAFIVSTVS